MLVAKNNSKFEISKLLFLSLLILFSITGILIGIYYEKTKTKSQNLIKKESSNIISQLPRDKVIIYVVEENDTLSLIAKRFGISQDTIRWENNLNNDKLFNGQELRILPVTGISYITREGDNLESIAKKFKTTTQKIIDFPYNEFSDPENFTIIPDQYLIIPDGKK